MNKRLIKFRVWAREFDYKKIAEEQKGIEIPRWGSPEYDIWKVNNDNLYVKYAYPKMYYPNNFGHSGDTIGWTNQPYLDIGCISSKDNLDNDVVLMQYTGFKDKNGLDIFEGDIVKVNPNHEAVFFDENLVGVEKTIGLIKYTHARVFWINSRFAVTQSDLGWTDLDDFATCNCHPCALEVIGNIFENAELLL